MAAARAARCGGSVIAAMFWVAGDASGLIELALSEHGEARAGRRRGSTGFQRVFDGDCRGQAIPSFRRGDGPARAAAWPIRASRRA